jgi:hypothetical protein
MAGRRRGGKATPVPTKRLAFFLARAEDQPTEIQLAVMCDYLRAAVVGKPDETVQQVIAQVRRLAQEVDR